MARSDARPCGFCRELFVPPPGKGRPERHCSDACRADSRAATVAAVASRQNERRCPPRPCAGCGRLARMGRGNHWSACSDACRQAAREARDADPSVPRCRYCPRAVAPGLNGASATCALPACLRASSIQWRIDNA